MADAASVKAVTTPEEVFARVLSDAVGVVERAGIPYLLIGGVGSAALGRPRWTHDIDVLVFPQDALRTLEAYARAGFWTERTNDHWIYKAGRQDIVIDLIFRLVGDIYLDEEMLSRAQRASFLGVEADVASPEDQIVVKAIANDEASSRHWNDALALIASGEIDWDYLLERAVKGPRRVLSLLVYAQSEDLVVPSATIARLFESIYGDG